MRLMLRVALAALLLLVGGPALADEPLEHRVGVETDGIESADNELVRQARVHLKQLSGKPIRAVSVETVGTLWQSKPTLESVELGAPLDAFIARRAIAELLAGGGFAQAYADARAFQDGVVLRIVAVPRRVIASIKIEGGKLDRSATMATASIGVDSEITEPRFQAIRAAIRTFYRRFGYHNAAIEISAKETDDPLRVALTVRIQPGEPRTIATRVFVVEPQYDAVLGSLKQEYEVAGGDRVDEDAMFEADNKMAELLRAKGFLQVSVKHTVLQRGEFAYLYVYLDTGPRHVFRFTGNRSFDETELVEALNLDKASDVSVADLAERIQTYYRNRGYLDVTAVGSKLGTADDAVHIIEFRIKEGTTVQVTERLFACLPFDAPDEVTATDLGNELDAFLEQDLPDLSFFHAVDELTVDSIFNDGNNGRRAPPRRLTPAQTYTPEVYERARSHLERYLNSKGYLNAIVGTPGVIRAECDPGARGERCEPLPLPPYPQPRCGQDALDLPVPEPVLTDAFACEPNPKRSIHCAPEIQLHIPVQLGPRSRLYDILFEGNVEESSQKLLTVAAFPLGSPFSQLELEAAKLRLLHHYRDLGYFYATVLTSVDQSPDRTRTRARFTINEHEPVVISDYEIRGAHRTDPQRIINRLALCQELDECKDDEKYYRQHLVRQSEEQIARLGPFSSVTIAIEDEEIPESRKRVIITVAEQRSQYIEPRGGFSTGEGFRIGGEYGHRNVAGQAISLTVRLEFSLLPDFLIFDDQVEANYDTLLFSERLERRNSLSVRFPDIGLGPQVDVVIDGIEVRDNQRDFGLTRQAVLPTLSYRPSRKWTLQLGGSVERNNVNVFGADTVEGAILANPALANLLRVPDGTTLAVSQRIGAAWDRRDNAFAATKGTFVSLGVEHVSAFPLDDETQITSEFLKFTSRTAWYKELSDGGIVVALSGAAGINVQLTEGSETYPDRLFFLGGVNTVRGFQLDSMVPQDVAIEVVEGRLRIEDVAVRGGDLYVNPRLELRVPVYNAWSVGIFLDTGNVWRDIGSISAVEDLLAWRYAAGLGARLDTLVGPIALDYGVNLVRREWEDFGAFHFSIGLF